MPFPVGLDCKLYRNTGTYATPVWNEITTVVDLTLTLDKAKAEVKARFARWLQSKPNLKSAALTFGLLADTAVDDYNSLRDAWLNDTIIDMAVADAAIATQNTQYFRADYYIYGFTRNEPLQEHANIDVAADLAYSNNAPAFTTVP